MRSQSRQENFSRTCWMTFQVRGTTSRRLGDVLAELGQAGAAAAGAGHWTGNDDALARQVLGERAPGRARAGEARHGGGLGRGGLGGQLVLGGCGLQLLELQLHLVQQAGGALGARAEAVAVEFLDLQLEMGDQRQVAGLLRHGGWRRHRRARPAGPP